MNEFVRKAEDVRGTMINYSGKKGPLISVIIPVFNTEKYLAECLESVLNQTYHKLEVIIIDDGSTDSSGEIIDRFAAEDERVKAVHKENMGRSAAKNDGLDLMTGEYFTFLDSDDVLERDALNTLADAVDNGSEIIIARLRKFIGKSDIPCEPESFDTYDISRKELLECFALDNMHIKMDNFVIDRGAVAKLYPEELKNVRFPCDLSYAEDYLYSLETILAARAYRYVDKVIYRYRKYEEEEKHFWRDFERFSLQGVDSRKRALKLVREKEKDIYEDFLLRTYYSVLDTYCSCVRLGYRESAEKISKELDIIKKELHNSPSVKELGFFRRKKLEISFISYRLYAGLYNCLFKLRSYRK